MTSAREVTVLDYEAPAQRAASPLAGKTIVFHRQRSKR